MYDVHNIVLYKHTSRRSIMSLCTTLMTCMKIEIKVVAIVVLSAAQLATKARRR